MTFLEDFTLKLKKGVDETTYLAFFYRLGTRHDRSMEYRITRMSFAGVILDYDVVTHRPDANDLSCPVEVEDWVENSDTESDSETSSCSSKSSEQRSEDESSHSSQVLMTHKNAVYTQLSGKLLSRREVHMLMCNSNQFVLKRLQLDTSYYVEFRKLSVKTDGIEYHLTEKDSTACNILRVFRVFLKKEMKIMDTLTETSCPPTVPNATACSQQQALQSLSCWEVPVAEPRHRAILQSKGMTSYAEVLERMEKAHTNFKEEESKFSPDSRKIIRDFIIAALSL